MKLEEYSIDDLHNNALAEFDQDEDAGHVLNSIYGAMKANYIAALKLLRHRRKPPTQETVAG